ncbi:ABC transporter ATP-binding protein [Umboniibacter marinipuniceus]|uniref:Putative ABC transport system ATP-binding protein n=1 Tax=Umboniibacter marinipuniceus TaxID=569599 RepID=A0A3M0ACK7_9GAMM|nr:ABC transporter ATP-binding protein [Umboniibacter marinipuniceus]RMA80185.1 putative ABC transport system ATP-binding protein [Umboniibacter marinipuniceus]
MALIELSKIDKYFSMGDQQLHVLRALDLSIEEGEFVAIMGPSGSGKSTLMNILGGLDTPSSGSYQLAGEAIADYSDDTLSAVRNRSFGFVFQSFHLMPRLSALDNVLLPIQYSKDPDWPAATERATNLLGSLGLEERIHFRPNQMSGGQRQRVAIARALVNEPKILFADEPTGALDSKTAVEIMALLTRLNSEGQTIILVTHELEIAELAKRIIFLRDGVIQREDLR